MHVSITEVYRCAHTDIITAPILLATTKVYLLLLFSLYVRRSGFSPTHDDYLRNPQIILLSLGVVCVR